MEQAIDGAKKGKGVRAPGALPLWGITALPVRSKRPPSLLSWGGFREVGLGEDEGGAKSTRLMPLGHCLVHRVL